MHERFRSTLAIPIFFPIISFQLFLILWFLDVLQCLIVRIQNCGAHTQTRTIKIENVSVTDVPNISFKSNEPNHRQNDAESIAIR